MMPDSPEPRGRRERAIERVWRSDERTVELARPDHPRGGSYGKSGQGVLERSPSGIHAA